MRQLAALLLFLTLTAAAQPPVILPPGAEGLDLKSYDAKRRAPTFQINGTSVSVSVPLVKPETLPRTLKRGEFRYVGVSALGIRHESSQTTEYYCPGRLIKALKMEEWSNGTPVVIGAYEGAEGKPAVVSLMPETVTPYREVSVPTGWTVVSPPAATELILRSPLGDSFACICPGRTERVLFSGQAAQPAEQDGLAVYQQSGSDWRVAVSRRATGLYMLVAPAQDYSILLESLGSYWLHETR